MQHAQHRHIKLLIRVCVYNEISQFHLRVYNSQLRFNFLVSNTEISNKKCNKWTHVDLKLDFFSLNIQISNQLQHIFMHIHDRKKIFLIFHFLYFHFIQAKFLFMVRDGRATVNSIISRKVTITGFDLTSYRQCMIKWNHAIETMHNQCKEIGSDKCMMVSD